MYNINITGGKQVKRSDTLGLQLIEGVKRKCKPRVHFLFYLEFKRNKKKTTFVTGSWKHFCLAGKPLNTGRLITAAVREETLAPGMCERSRAMIKHPQQWRIKKYRQRVSAPERSSDTRRFHNHLPVWVINIHMALITGNNVSQSCKHTSFYYPLDETRAEIIIITFCAAWVLGLLHYGL